MNVVIKRRDYNVDTLSTDSTNEISSTTRFTNLRTRTRQVVLRFESDDDNSVTANIKDFKFRVGDTRLDIQPSGRRG